MYSDNLNLVGADYCIAGMLEAINITFEGVTIQFMCFSHTEILAILSPPYGKLTFSFTWPIAIISIAFMYCTRHRNL